METYLDMFISVHACMESTGKYRFLSTKSWNPSAGSLAHPKYTKEIRGKKTDNKKLTKKVP